MIKICSNCTAEYWARWRNEPTTLCPDCRDDAVLCTSCGAMQRAPADASQLTLWPMLAARRHEQREIVRYVAPPRAASQQTKRKYPYQ